MQKMLILLLLGIFPCVSLACSPHVTDEPYVQNTFLLKQDGSFRYGGLDDVYSGKAFVDQGFGKVTQRIRAFRHACHDTEDLLISDCLTASTLLISGRMTADSEMFEGAFWTSVDRALYPNTNLKLYAKWSLVKLGASAEDSQVPYHYNVHMDRDIVPDEAQFDPFWGCKKFYPDSKGAQL